MKPVVSLGKAWCCTVFSALCALILGVFAILFAKGNHELTSHDKDTTNAENTAKSLGIAVLLYLLIIVFCCSQIITHKRQPRSISLQ